MATARPSSPTTRADRARRSASAPAARSDSVANPRSRGRSDVFTDRRGRRSTRLAGRRRGFADSADADGPVTGPPSCSRAARPADRRGSRSPRPTTPSPARRWPKPRSLTPDDRQLVVLPLFHANAQYYSFASAIAVGCIVALMHTFSASGFVDQAARHEATYASLFAGADADDPGPWRASAERDDPR